MAATTASSLLAANEMASSLLAAGEGAACVGKRERKIQFRLVSTNCAELLGLSAFYLPPLFCCTTPPNVSPPCSSLRSLMAFFASFLFFLLLLSSPLPLADSFSVSGAGRGSVRDGRHGRVRAFKPRPWIYSGEGSGSRHGGSRLVRGKGRRGKNAGGAFSAMLPRGFVPPSDSSWCHNGSPQSAALFCSGKLASPPPQPTRCLNC
ncbi:hypothetical protein ZIOFF_055794 [Zingiber officinale]|uniref:Uncharacterized protein n=1 Tax=Zingiber officinale TaxID=94328 RepID=A0A8J5FX13_ZINOF|nr:hypothetical protein ZIOFF_055794 [Zingiber officinale]